jgi:CubicO group peptidase (beta-lactamase class C family)
MALGICGGLPVPAFCFPISLEEAAYAAKGYAGHYLAVFPARDLLVVHRAETERPDGTIIDPGDAGYITSTQFGTLLALLLEACPQL